MFGQARPRLVYADVGRDAALLALQARLEGLARRAGASVPARRFHPHVTLGRFPPMPPGDRAMRLERAVALGGGFALGPFASGPVVLFRSDAAGARRHYSALARYGEPG
jgi:2'-5' RNA ligase